MSTQTITAADKQAAREASAAADRKKAEKAEKERQRRAGLKTMQAQIEKAGLPEDTALDKDQKNRAIESAAKKAGLSGKQLATYILEGKGVTDTVAESKQATAAAKSEERTRQNITRSADPEASGLAADAKKLAPEVKSAFLPKDAREFLDLFKVERDGTQRIKVSRTDGDTAVEFKRADLRRFSAEGEKDKEVRAELATLGKGTRLWGRKLGLMILATDAKLH